MIYPDIVVLGTGRSGTSFVCKVLAERLGICWGRGIDPRPQPPVMKSGMWEDRNMKAWNKALAQTKITPEEWLEQFTKAHTKCRKRNVKPPRLHGVKDPYLSMASPLVWGVIKPKLIIEAYRTPEQVLESNRKNAPWRSPEYWEWFGWVVRNNIASLEVFCSRNAIPFITLRLSKVRTPDYIYDSIIQLLDI